MKPEAAVKLTFSIHRPLFLIKEKGGCKPFPRQEQFNCYSGRTLERLKLAPPPLHKLEYIIGCVRVGLRVWPHLHLASLAFRPKFSALPPLLPPLRLYLQRSMH